MSVDSTTLERSALERKDREELTTIAQALGAKPPSRARKAEIVQMILELTGVASPADRPTADAAVEPSSADSDAAAASGAPGASAGAAGRGEAPASAAGGAPAPGAAPATAPAPAGEAGASGASALEGPTQEPLAEWEQAVAADAPTEDRPTDGMSGGTTSTTYRHAGAGVHGALAADERPSRHEQPDQGAPSGEAGSERRDDRSGPPDRGAQVRDQQNRDQQNRDRQNRDQQNRDQQGNGQPRGDQQGGGLRTEPGAGQSGPQGAGDLNEPGNRRRRRRGRRGGNEPQPGAPPEEFQGEPVEVSGLLDLRDEGYGFLRVKGSLPSKDDIYVSVKQARQFGLRKGDHIVGASRPALRNEKNPALLRIDQVNGQTPDLARKRRRFEDLTPLFPDEKLRLETADGQSDMTARIVDLISPIGKGQRGLIVSPPKAGKTTIMKQIARSIEANNPEVKLIVLLVDERPEEVTDMRRWLRNETSEVVASTFDRPSEEHAQVSELTIERAKRLVEEGRDVCIILDGITRLARAYNLAAPATGRIMSGGVDSGALYPPKRFFGAARNVEEGGSLTILATALIETGSKMDEVIFEEFKGTGNMELRLDRRLAERRVYPAIDVDASSTRHEELLFARQQLNLVWALRRVLQGLSSSDGGNAAALELLIDRMKTFSTNEEFLAQVARNRLAAG